MGSVAVIGPSSGSQAAASNIIFFVSGANGGSGPFDLPFAATVGVFSVVSANIYALNGTLALLGANPATGSFLARDVIVGAGTKVTLDSAFADDPPTADPQTVFTIGDVDLEITLTGSDPEGGDLSFSILVGPTEGTLSAITPIVPDPITTTDREGNSVTVQPAITSATLTYNPNGAGDLEDFFTFAVTDVEGAIGSAVVGINPDDVSPPSPATTDVDAEDVEVDISVGQTAEITLAGTGPEGTSLTFRILTVPDGSLVDSASVAVEGERDVPSALLTYMPPTGSSTQSFQFSVRDSLTSADPCPTGSPVTCDSAAVNIDISEPFELAPDQEVTTNKNEPVQFSVVANLGGVGNGGGQGLGAAAMVLKARKAAALPGAMIAGNVSDADEDGVGDGRDNLPGSAPGFIAAAVDVNLPTVTSGTFDKEADLLAELNAFDTFDFETASGFPASGGSIGLVNGIDFDAQTFSFINSTSPTQSMTGSGGTATVATVDFTGLAEKPIAFGFFALDLTQIGPEVIRVTVNFSDATQQVIDVQLGIGDPNQTSIYLGFIDVSKTIDSLEFVGTEVGGTCPETVCRTWVIDDLTVGTARKIAGNLRIQVEWDVTSLAGLGDQIANATVTLNTHRGSVDSLDTMFFVGDQEQQDGLLAPSDYQAPATELSGVVMPVPAGSLPGDDGTFSFDVTRELTSAVNQGLSFFSIQGRVDESLADGNPVPLLRGLEVRSTATGNLATNKEPQLDVLGVPPPSAITITMLTLPTAGTVTDFTGALVSVGQTFSSTTDLVYTPPLNVSGTFRLTYEATEGQVIDTAQIDFIVGLDDGCAEVGRPPGCSI